MKLIEYYVSEKYIIEDIICENKFSQSKTETECVDVIMKVSCSCNGVSSIIRRIASASQWGKEKKQGFFLG